jgi:hypothetical protein
VPLPRLEYGSKTPLKWLLSKSVYYKLDTIPMTMATINFANFRNAQMHGEGVPDGRVPARETGIWKATFGVGIRYGIRCRNTQRSRSTPD